MELYEYIIEMRAIVGKGKPRGHKVTSHLKKDIAIEHDAANSDDIQTVYQFSPLSLHVESQAPKNSDSAWIPVHNINNKSKSSFVSARPSHYLRIHGE